MTQHYTNHAHKQFRYQRLLDATRCPLFILYRKQCSPHTTRRTLFIEYYYKRSFDMTVDAPCSFSTPISVHMTPQGVTCSFSTLISIHMTPQSVTNLFSLLVHVRMTAQAVTCSFSLVISFHLAKTTKQHVHLGL